MKKRNKKLDGTRRPIELLFDDFIVDINYFDDVSLKKTIHFFVKNNANKLTESLFTFDITDNSMIYFKKKTIVGFMIISGNYNKFMDLLDNIELISDSSPMNKWTKDKSINHEIYNTVNEYVTENFIISDHMINLYKEYFCLDYQIIRTKDITGIKCDKNNVSDKEKIKIYEELIIKLSYFLHYYNQIVNKNAMKIIINHYILKFLKSDRAEHYNISLVLGSREYSENEIELYNIFNDINIGSVFKVLKMQSNFKYKDKFFSTCGETTLLNILNYCLKNSDGTFNTDKILNENVKNFYKRRKMFDIGTTESMVDWLDIVSNLNLSQNVYNLAGDIHNDVKNVACVLNKIVYDNDDCNDITEPHKFITDIIKYISNEPIEIDVEKSTEHSISMIIDNIYYLFFRPGHGEMNLRLKSETKSSLKTINFNDVENGSEPDYKHFFGYEDDFDIIYSIYKNMLSRVDNYNDDNDDEKEDNIIYLDDDDEALSDILVCYFNNTKHKVVQLLMLEIHTIFFTDNIKYFGENENHIINFLKNLQNVDRLKIKFNNDDNVSSFYDNVNLVIKNIPKYFNNLEELDIQNRNGEHAIEISPISKLKNLKILNLKYVTLRYLKLPKLIDFTYDGNSKLTDTFFSGINNIEKLVINNRRNKYIDCQIFESLNNIKRIQIDNYGRNNYKFINIEKLPKSLEFMFIPGCDLTDSLETIINLPNLQDFYTWEPVFNKSYVLIKNKNINPQILKTLSWPYYKIAYHFQQFVLISHGMQKMLFDITEITTMGQLFKIFTEHYGNGDKYEFYLIDTSGLLGPQVKDEDTMIDLGFKPFETDEIKIKAYKNSSSTKKSSSRKSPKMSSRKSPKKSSSKKSSSRKSPKISSSIKSPKVSSSRKSPKISIDGKRKFI
jgi:hypothetical protein